jgi:type IV pilus assembly protein PilC
MPSFIYKVRDKAGKPESGIMEADSANSLVTKLRNMGYFVISIEEAVARKKNIFSLDLRDYIRKVRGRDLVIFSHQLTTMISSGLTLITSLRILTQQLENPKLRHIVDKVRQSVEEGSSFSDALAMHPRAFSHLFVSMVRAGETGGVLEQVLERLANFAERSEELKGNIKGALTYPFLLIIMAVAVMTFLVSFVLPKFTILFVTHGIRLPLPTLILINTGQFFRSYWYFVFAILGFFIFGFFLFGRTKNGRYVLDTVKLRLIIFGTINLKVIISRFSRTLATLVAGGVPILESLQIVEETSGNTVVAKLISKVREGVNKGETISKNLLEDKTFPPMIGQMINVGEETGALDKVLYKVADFYDREIQYTIQRLTALLEPMLLLIIGFVVAFVALSLFLPMFDMYKVIR